MAKRQVPPHTPLFTFNDGTFLTPKTVSYTLKATLRLAGHNLFEPHWRGYICIHCRPPNTETGQMEKRLFQDLCVSGSHQVITLMTGESPTAHTDPCTGY